MAAKSDAVLMVFRSSSKAKKSSMEEEVLFAIERVWLLIKEVVDFVLDFLAWKVDLMWLFVLEWVGLLTEEGDFLLVWDVGLM